MKLPKTAKVLREQGVDISDDYEFDHVEKALIDLHKTSHGQWLEEKSKLQVEIDRLKSMIEDLVYLTQMNQ